MSTDPNILADAQVLQKCSLFSALDEKGRRALAERSHRRRFQVGEFIFRFGDAGQSMMAVLVGTVRISRPTSRGKEMILADLRAGDIIGEIAVLDGKQRSADAAALTNVELLVLDRREILPFLEGHPSLCLKLLGLLCARLRLADERMADVGFVDLAARLAKTLLRNAPPGGERNRSFKLALSQTELAEMIGGTRESVNRQLRAWQKLEILRLQSGWIVVLNHGALASFAKPSMTR